MDFRGLVICCRSVVPCDRTRMDAINVATAVYLCLECRSLQPKVMDNESPVVLKIPHSYQNTNVDEARRHLPSMLSTAALASSSISNSMKPKPRWVLATWSLGRLTFRNHGLSSTAVFGAQTQSVFAKFGVFSFSARYTRRGIPGVHS